MPNLAAFAMLALWPLVTAALWLKLPPARALVISLVAGYLLLPPMPAALDLPILPPLGKDTLPALSCLMMALFLHRQDLRLWPKGTGAQILVVAFLLSPVFTVLNNPEPLVWGPRYLPGLSPREALSAVVAQGVTLLPLLLGRHFLTTLDDQRELFTVLAIAALGYALPVLVELRLSPQMNIWVYGFFQHLFEQMVRGGGYRPIVFLYHALWVAFFLFTGILALAALARGATGRGRWIAALALAGLCAVLLLGRSYAAIFYTLACVPVVLWAPRRMMLGIAAALVTVALVYPLAKAGGFVPEDRIVALAGELGPDRAHTLQFRFDNETALVARAAEKPLFGWGLWGRNHIYDTTDGRFLTISDGRWIIVLGVLGFAGFFAEFGLLSLPVFVLWLRSRPRAARPLPDAANLYAAPLALLLGVNMFDLIPNATITQLTWLVAGVLLGHAERAHAPAAAPRGAARTPTVMAIRTAI